MPISSKLKAAAFASIAAMGGFALMTGTPAFADHHAKAAETNQPNIVETAMGTGVHGTLVAAERRRPRRGRENAPACSPRPEVHSFGLKIIPRDGPSRLYTFVHGLIDHRNSVHVS